MSKSKLRDLWAKAVVESSKTDQPKRTSADLVKQIAALNPMSYTVDDRFDPRDEVDIFSAGTWAAWQEGTF